jgi:hypothetical protein
MSDIKKRVTAIQGIPVSSVPPTIGQVLMFNGIEYVPTTLTTFLPTNVPGLELWLRSDKGVTLSGSMVTGWADQSGTGDTNKNMVGGGGSANPTYNTSDSSYNNYPSINFADASSQFMNSGTWTTSIAQPYTIFVVGNDDGTSGAGAEVFVGGATVTNPWFYNNAGLYSLLAGGTDFTSISATGIPEVFRGEYNGSSSTLSVSKTTPNTSGTVGAGSIGAGTSGVWLGTDEQYESSHFLNGKIVEVIVYNSILSSSNVALVQNYLSARYAIAISS